MSDAPSNRWRRPVDAAGVLLAVFLFAQVARYRVTETVQSALWVGHSFVPAVPQVGDKELIPVVHAAIWLAIPVAVGLLVLGVVWSDPGENPVDSAGPGADS